MHIVNNTIDRCEWSDSTSDSFTPT